MPSMKGNKANKSKQSFGKRRQAARRLALAMNVRLAQQRQRGADPPPVGEVVDAVDAVDAPCASSFSKQPVQIVPVVDEPVDPTAGVDPPQPNNT